MRLKLPYLNVAFDHIFKQIHFSTFSLANLCAYLIYAHSDRTFSIPTPTHTHHCNHTSRIAWDLHKSCHRQCVCVYRGDSASHRPLIFTHIYIHSPLWGIFTTFFNLYTVRNHWARPPNPARTPIPTTELHIGMSPANDGEQLQLLARLHLSDRRVSAVQRQCAQVSVPIWW